MKTIVTSKNLNRVSNHFGRLLHEVCYNYRKKGWKVEYKTHTCSTQDYINQYNAGMIDGRKTIYSCEVDVHGYPVYAWGNDRVQVVNSLLNKIENTLFAYVC